MSGPQTVNRDRLEVIAGILRGIGLEGILDLEEEDPQFHAVKRVASALGAGNAGVAAVLNAIVSYRLAMRGEDWWECWSEWHSSRSIGCDSIECLAASEIGFLRDCRGSVIQRSAKIRRVGRAASNARSVLEKLRVEPGLVLSSGRWLVEGLARALRAKPWSKTIVFAAKMAYYAARIESPGRPAPRDVEIPVDVRVACFLYSTGIVEAPSYRSLVSQPRIAQEAVRLLAEETGIPPLNLDTLFWLSGWAPRDLELGEANRVFSRLSGGKSSERVFVRKCV